MHDGPREETSPRYDPTLQFALNHNWEENIPVDGVVLKKRCQMSWLLSRSQRRVNTSALASTAVVSGCGGPGPLFILLFGRTESLPVWLQLHVAPFSSAITAVIAQPLMERLSKNVSAAQPPCANVCVGTGLFSFRYITHACAGWPAGWRAVHNPRVSDHQEPFRLRIHFVDKSSLEVFQKCMEN